MVSRDRKIEDFGESHEMGSCVTIRGTAVIKFGRELGEDIYFEIRWKIFDLELPNLLCQPELL